MKVSSAWRHFATIDLNWITLSANLGILRKAKYLKNNETPHFATTKESLSLPNLKLKRWYRVTRHMLAIAEFSRNTSHSTSHAEWGIVLLSGGYVSSSPKSFGIYLWHAIHNCIGCKWNWPSGGSCFFLLALSHSLFHCWITNRHHLYHLCFEAFNVSWLLNAYSTAQMGSPQGQSHSSHHPQLWFCLGQFSFFNLPGLFLSCFECCILEPDSEEGSTSVRFDFATPALFPPYPLARALLVPFPFHTQGKGTYVRSP